MSFEQAELHRLERLVAELEARVVERDRAFERLVSLWIAQRRPDRLGPWC